MLCLNYNISQLEWLTSIPWPSSSSSRLTALEVLTDRQFLSKARKQLDADHYGLEKIKRRLIEYLAIVRLKELAAHAESERALVLHMDNSLSVPPPVRRVKGPILLSVFVWSFAFTGLTSSIGLLARRELGRLLLPRLWLGH